MDELTKRLIEDLSDAVKDAERELAYKELKCRKLRNQSCAYAGMITILAGMVFAMGWYISSRDAELAELTGRLGQCLADDDGPTIWLRPSNPENDGPAFPGEIRSL